MVKQLSEMTLEELWELFPIILTAHNDSWEDWFVDEEDRLSAILSSENVIINHIGSTAIKNIWAKPIIDILVETMDCTALDQIKTILCLNGYICMSDESDRKSFNKGYTTEGFSEKVFHLHLRIAGDNDELYFRDYMNDNPDLAQQYQNLKISLWKRFEHDRDGYTSAKTEFIMEHTAKAKITYHSRYQRIDATV